MTQEWLATLKSSRREFPMLDRERGSILFVGLILLFILSLIGITSMRTTTQQERMSGNLRDRTVAFQAAESALAAAEKTYFTKSPVLDINTTNGAFDGSSCTKGLLKYCPSTAVCAGATTVPAPYLVAYGRGDGADPVFWRSTYKDYWATCGYGDNEDGIVYVDNDNYGKPGYPFKSPRYVIEQISDLVVVESYRVTAIGYGFTDTAVVVLQATYSKQ
jgi:type IV pilus assembly protein PilX